MSFSKINYFDIYNIIYKNKNYSSEVKYLIKLFKILNIKSKTILDLGSGTGKHLFFFLDKNYKITGVEKSQAMIEHADKKVRKYIIRSDINNLHLKEKYNIILSQFNVIGYFNTDSSVKNFFKTTSFHLKKNGVLIFDFWNSEAVNFLKPKKKIKIFKEKNLIIKKISTPQIISNKIINIKFDFFCKSNFSKKNYKKKINHIKFSKKFKIRHFEINELICFAEKFNLKYIDSYSMLRFDPPSNKSWSTTAIFRKI
jgi:SAM-dependent methyltransferase